MTYTHWIKFDWGQKVSCTDGELVKLRRFWLMRTSSHLSNCELRCQLILKIRGVLAIRPWWWLCLWKLINSRTAIAGAIIGLLLVFYNSKNLITIQRIWIVLGRCLFLRLVHKFSWFLKSNWSSDFGHAEAGSGAKDRVLLPREFFSL